VKPDDIRMLKLGKSRNLRVEKIQKMTCLRNVFHQEMGMDEFDSD
jgi:hypothetical protein